MKLYCFKRSWDGVLSNIYTPDITQYLWASFEERLSTVSKATKARISAFILPLRPHDKSAFVALLTVSLLLRAKVFLCFYQSWTNSTPSINPPGHPDLIYPQRFFSQVTSQAVCAISCALDRVDILTYDLTLYATTTDSCLALIPSLWLL